MLPSSSGIDQVPAELLRQEVIHNVPRSRNLLMLFAIRKNCHSSGRNPSLYPLIKRVIKLTVVITVTTTYKISPNIPDVNVIIGDYQCGFRRNK
jgi:hypothetical protein